MAYADTVLELNPVSYWRLGEASGNLKDLVANIDAVPSGAVTQGAPGAIAPPGSDGAVDLTGVTGYLNIGDNYDFAGTAPFSWSIWVYASALTGAGFPRLFDKNNVSGWRSLYNGTTGQFPTFSRYDSGGVGDTAVHNGFIVVGSWVHVVGTYDGAQLIVYLNGVAGTPIASTRSMPGNASNLLIGGAGGAATAHSGRLDEAIIWDRALTAAEVRTLYEAASYTPPATYGPLGDLTRDDEGDASFIDQYDKTVVGTSGFGEAVEDQLTTGVPNGLFAQSDALAQTSDYFTESDPAGALTVSVDATRPGGYVWEFQASAAASASLATGLIPVTDGRTYEFATQMYYVGANVTWDAIITWYDARGVALPTLSTLALDTVDMGGVASTWMAFRRRTINPNSQAAHYASLTVQWDWASGSVDSRIDRMSFLPAEQSMVTWAAPPSPILAVASDGNITLNPNDILMVPILIPGVLPFQGVAIQQGSSSLARAWEWKLYRLVRDRAFTFDAIAGAFATGGAFTPTGASTETLNLTNLPGPEIGPGMFYIAIRNAHATNTLVIRRTAKIGIAGAIGSAGLTEAGHASLPDLLTLSAYSNTEWPHVLLTSSY